MIKSEEEPNTINYSNQLTPTPHSDNPNNKNFEVKTPDSMNNIRTKDLGDSFELKEENDERQLEKIYDFFIKNPEKFQQELELKNIIVEEDFFLLRKNWLKDYQLTIKNSKSIEENKLEEPINQLDQMTNWTLVETLQSLIDEGELLHAFHIYLVLKHKILVPDKQVRLWSHSYIELLRSNHLHKEANEIIKASSIIEIKNLNKVLFF